MKYIDAHSHWSHKQFANEDLDLRLRACLEKHIDFILQGGTDPAEWQSQIQLKQKYPQHFGLCLGLHPYFVSDNSSEVCELGLDELSQWLPQAMALGEAGLDFRPHIVKESEGLQIEIFENQIELAKAFHKPMVLHIVQAHEKALQIFDIWGAPEKKGFLHGFNASYEVAKKYLDKGFLISIGGAITFEKNKKLQECVRRLPLEVVLIESDAPDQAPSGWVGLNDSTSIYNVAQAVAELKNLTSEKVLETSACNFKNLFTQA